MPALVVALFKYTDFLLVNRAIVGHDVDTLVRKRRRTR
jgi:hypothetical protein